MQGLVLCCGDPDKSKLREPSKALPEEHWQSAWRRLLGILIVGLSCSQATLAYSVLTHEEIVDLVWEDQIRPLLDRKFPGLSEEQTREAILSPLTMIASDGFIENGRGHPRTSGTYAKVLGKYVRDEHALALMDALRKMTLMPAHRLEARVPSMSAKGRVRVGADADLTVFDPATVIDKSTYENATLTSTGIPYVIVGGQVVVDSGHVTKARPGRAIRAPHGSP